jgi:NADH/F420H2 dehydrogenase subunit C
MNVEKESITVNKLKHNFSELELAFVQKTDYDEVTVPKDEIFSILNFLKNEPELDYNFLMDLGVVDYLKYPLKRPERFDVIYNLYSLEKKHRVIIKAPVNGKKSSIDSVSSLWSSANWAEREAFDMYGISFKNHPNLRRILNHHEFVGHPLRKDYPIRKRQALSANDSLMDEMELRLKEKGLK